MRESLYVLTKNVKFNDFILQIDKWPIAHYVAQCGNPRERSDSKMFGLSVTIMFMKITQNILELFYL